MPAELRLCAFAEAEQLLSGLLGFDLPVTEMGMDGLSIGGLLAGHGYRCCRHEELLRLFQGLN